MPRGNEVTQLMCMLITYQWRCGTFSTLALIFYFGQAWASPTIASWSHYYQTCSGCMAPSYMFRMCDTLIHNIVPAIRPPKKCSSNGTSWAARTFTWSGTDLTDSCSTFTNLDHSTSTINISPVFECSDHVSSSHITTVTRVCHSCCENDPHAIIWACQLGVLQVDWGKVTRTLATYYVLQRGSPPVTGCCFVVLFPENQTKVVHEIVEVEPVCNRHPLITICARVYVVQFWLNFPIHNDLVHRPNYIYQPDCISMCLSTYLFTTYYLSIYLPIYLLIYD